LIAYFLGNILAKNYEKLIHLPQTTLCKYIKFNDFRNRLNAYLSAGGEHFKHKIGTLYKNILTDLCLLFHKL